MRRQRSVALVVLAAMLAVVAPAAPDPQVAPASAAATGSAAMQVRIAQLGGAVEPDAYEPDDAAENASELTLDGVRQARTLHVQGDVDWAWFTLSPGDRVLLYTTGFCDTFMYLVAANATQVLRRDDDSGEDLNAAILYTARDAGTYYARVVAFDSNELCPEYELVGLLLPPIPPDEYEPDDTVVEARELPLSGARQERTTHAGGNEDWVFFNLQAGNRVNLFTTGRCDTLLFLYAPDGVTLLADDDDSGVGLNADIEYVVGETGTYYARVRQIDDDEVCDGYELVGSLLPPVAADAYENDDSPAQAKPLVLDGNPQERTFHANGDNDWVTFSLNAGDRVFLMTTGPCDTLLFLYRQDGTTLLRRDDDSGEDLNAALLYTALETGTYYARVAPISRARGICDGYRLYGARFPLTAATPTAVPTSTPTATPTAQPISPTPVPAGPSPTRTAAPRPPGF